MRTPQLHCDQRADGSIILKTDYVTPEPHQSLIHLFEQRALQYPQRTFVARREQLANGERGEWQRISYGETVAKVRAIAQALIDRGCGPNKSVMVISGPSIEHALFMLGAFAARAAYAPLSTGYSLFSTDDSKLRHCFETCQPAVIFADDGPAYEAALRSLPTDNVEIISVKLCQNLKTTAFTELINTLPTSQVDDSIAAITTDTHARTIFTSGSTGASKGVIHTHGNITADIAQHDAMYIQSDREHADAMLSWLPWSHIGGANNFSIAINGAKTLYVDEGKPVAGEVKESLRNLREISPEHFPSPPALFPFLLEAMDKDSGFRDFFFKKLRLIIYGGAALTQDLLDRLQAAAVAATGLRIPITTKYGSTETAGITQAPWPLEQTGHIGVPNAGVTLKLAPVGNHLEARVKSPCVTPGYLNNPTATAKAFDEEGFYCTGDAARLVDASDPNKGLAFDGRVVENFKLASGTWVAVGQLRGAVIEALGLLQDCVIAGHDRNDVRILAWLRAGEATAIAGLSSACLSSPSPNPAPNITPETSLQALGRSTKVIDFLTARLKIYNSSAGGNSRRVARLMLLSEKPAGMEIADKGYINQRAVLEKRHDLVERLYAEDSPVVIADCSCGLRNNRN